MLVHLKLFFAQHLKEMSVCYVNSGAKVLGNTVLWCSFIGIYVKIKFEHFC